VRTYVNIWARHNGRLTTPSIVAILTDQTLEVKYCLVKELGADVNQPMEGGFTPLMAAVHFYYRSNNQALVKHFVHRGALVRARSMDGSTVLSMLQEFDKSATQIVYLEVRESYANPGREGGGR
jgi:hypothetical protein